MAYTNAHDMHIHTYNIPLTLTASIYIKYMQNISVETILIYINIMDIMIHIRVHWCSMQSILFIDNDYNISRVKLLVHAKVANFGIE